MTREPGRPTRGQIVLLAALSAFGPLSLDMYLPGLPPLTRDLHTTASAAQLTITACMIGLGVGQVIAGPLSDARGRRTPLLAGIIGYTVSSVACAVSPTVGVLVLMRLLQGMAGSVGIVIARAIVRDLSGGTVAARLFGVLMGITGVVPVAAPLIGGQVLLVTSWRGVFVVLAALGVPLVVATAMMLPETLPAHQRHGGGLGTVLHRFGALLRDRRYLPSALAFSLSFAAMFGYISGSSYVLENVFGISPQLFSLIFAVNSGGLITLSLLGSRAVGRRGSGWLLRRGLIGTAGASIGALAVTLTHAGLWPLLACFFVLLCANGVVLPNGTASAMATQTGSLGAASALLGLGQFGFGALVAPLVGVGGSRDALPMAVVIAVAGTAALLVNLAFAPRAAPVSAP
ncbi:MAG TPA: multidrug effflux MFS transporter [Solirubrobacteraceae bacterium]|nr:multidrug effflux MFS transporter [Solirubrobacteraceae bacterium]